MLKQVTELEMFTTRFRNRLVEMRLDVNNEVASSTMRLLTIFARQIFEFELVLGQI